MDQLNLLSVVTNTYLESDGPLDNAALYKGVAVKMGLSKEEVNKQSVVDDSGTRHKLFYRTVRWVQQSLKQKKLLTNVSKGVWELTGNGKIKLHAIAEGKRVLAMSTKLGICIWSKNENIFDVLIDGPIHLVLTSPPYPLKVQRAYGNVELRHYVDFICKVFESIVKKMAKGASIALNVSNDIFEDKLPARSTYVERLVIALEDRFGLYKMDTLVWQSNKPPGPLAWASKKRYQLNVYYEPILWFCNSPNDCFADNRRVLLPHEDAHKKFMESGGLKSDQVNADGNYIKKAGSYGNITKGKIPKNVMLQFANNCDYGDAVSNWAKRSNIPPHSAKMPALLCKFLIEYLTQPEQTVLDPFAGTLTTGQCAEMTGRKWICVEMIWEYIRQSFVRFEGIEDFWVNPNFASAFKVAC
jgi:site-specific DNA-methyltransferase (cytosine-N4-specific)